MGAKKRIAEALEQIAALLQEKQKPEPQLDLESFPALRWRVHRDGAFLEGIVELAPLSLDDLVGIDRQKREVERNTLQFLQGLPANNVLLTGARGTGKSSLVRALVNKYHTQNLRAIEVERDHLVDLAEILDRVKALENFQQYKFIVYCDDLTFTVDEPAYKALKSALDGSLAAPGDNVLIYATSNHRHLMPETMQDNLASSMASGELRPAEAIEEKVSLSERFGLWFSFYSFTQDEYLAVVRHWLDKHGVDLTDELAVEACRFATGRGSRSGRVAQQFVRDKVGALGLE